MIYSLLLWMIGKRSDAADAAGSLHAKIGDLKNKLGNPTDTRADNTVLGMSNTQIKSVQRGTSSITNGSSYTTVTISSVNTNKSLLVITGSLYNSSSTNLGDYQVDAVLTNSTTITLTRTNATNGTTVPWQVIEFY